MTQHHNDVSPAKAVILAGGLGLRLRPFTAILPKPMLPVGDRSVLEIQIEHLKKFGITDIAFAANYKSDVLQSYFGDGSRFGVSLTYSIEDQPLGTCGPLSLLAGVLTAPFLVLNGDILTNINIAKAFAFHTSHGGLLTVVSKMVTFPLSYGNIIAEGDRIVGIQEKPDISVEVAAGIYVMSPEILAHIPQNRHYGMDTLIADLIDQGIPVHKYRMDEYWLDIGRMEDFEKAQREVGDVFKD